MVLTGFKKKLLQQATLTLGTFTTRHSLAVAKKIKMRATRRNRVARMKGINHASALNDKPDVNCIPC